MAQRAAGAFCLLLSVSHDPQFPQDDTGGPTWLPTQALGCITGEEHCAWRIHHFQNEQVCSLSGGRCYLLQI